MAGVGMMLMISLVIFGLGLFLFLTFSRRQRLGMCGKETPLDGSPQSIVMAGAGLAPCRAEILRRTPHEFHESCPPEPQSPPVWCPAEQRLSEISGGPACCAPPYPRRPRRQNIFGLRTASNTAPPPSGPTRWPPPSAAFSSPDTPAAHTVRT